MLMTTPALILAIVLGALLIITNVALIMKKAFSVGTLLTSMIGAAVIALMVYDTDCLTRGSCVGWSWIRTILYSIVPVVTILYSVSGIVTSPSTSTSGGSIGSIGSKSM